MAFAESKKRTMIAIMFVLPFMAMHSDAFMTSSLHRRTWSSRQMISHHRLSAGRLVLRAMSEESWQSAMSRAAERAGVVAEEENEGKDASSITEGVHELRKVELELPASSVAAKKRRKRRTVSELKPPTESLGGSAGEAGVSGPSATATRSGSIGVSGAEGRAPVQQRAAPLKGSIADMGSTLMGQMQDNVLLGRVAPALAVGVAAGAIIRKLNVNRNEKIAEYVKLYGMEMLKYDGNTAVLKEVQADYNKKVKGRANKEKMQIEFLRKFLATKALSGSAISSIALFISNNKLSDEKFANLCVKLSEEYMEQYKERPVAVGKLIFIASRVLNGSDEALAILEPTKEAVIKYTYREKITGQVALELDPEGSAKFAESQVLLAKTAVRTKAKNLPESVETMEDARALVTEEGRLLGLTQDMCNQIFDEILQEELDAEAEAEATAAAAKEAAAEKAAMEADETIDPAKMLKGALGEDDEDETSPISGAAGDSGDALICECTECGYTLFVAAGREEKFFPEGFTCPECGTTKDKFNVRKQGE